MSRALVEISTSQSDKAREAAKQRIAAPNNTMPDLRYPGISRTWQLSTAKAGNAQGLHPFDELQANAEAWNLSMIQVNMIRVAIGVNVANELGEDKEAVGVGKHNQRDRAKKQCGGSIVHAPYLDLRRRSYP